MKKNSKGERSAQKILDATAHCIATVGIEKASVTRIAHEAGVSRALVAHYFPQKSKIFLQVIEHIVRKAYQEFGQAGDEDGAQSLERVLTSNLNFFLGRPDYLKCFILFYYFCGLDRSYRALNTKLTVAGRMRIEKALRIEGRANKDLAHSIHAELVGAILQYYAVDERMDQSTYTKRFLQRIRRHLKAR